MRLIDEDIELPASIFIDLTDEVGKEFNRLCRSGKTTGSLKERLSIVLLADEGLTNTEIAELIPLTTYRSRNRTLEKAI